MFSAVVLSGEKTPAVEDASGVALGSYAGTGPAEEERGKRDLGRKF